MDTLSDDDTCSTELNASSFSMLRWSDPAYPRLANRAKTTDTDAGDSILRSKADAVDRAILRRCPGARGSIEIVSGAGATAT